MRSFRLSGHLLGSRAHSIAALVVLAAALQLAAGLGLAYVAGFWQIRAALFAFQWVWLIACVGALAISFVGYYFAYQGIYTVDGGPVLARPHLRAVVIAGFGGFLAHSGAALDEYALKAAGAEERDAKVRVSALAGMEHGVLALYGCGAAIAVLVAGLKAPPLDFSLPWAIIPIPGFLIAFWWAGRSRAKWRHKSGWRGKLGVFLDSIYVVRQFFEHPVRYRSVLLGMALFWLADGFAAWAGLAMFGFKMNIAQFIVGAATGMVFTRRTGPLAGAGVLALVLPLTLWYSGAVLAVAVVGIFAYRVLAFWAPMPFSLAAMPTLRRMGERSEPYAEGRAANEKEPALRREHG